MHSPGDHDADLNGLRYRIRRAGRADRPAVLMLHGFTGSRLNWDRCIEALREDADVLAVDLPGHGDSDVNADPARFAMPQCAVDMSMLIARGFARPAHVLGYSMGARLALHIGTAHPTMVRSLVLESGSPGLADHTERAARKASDEALAARIERRGVRAFVDEWEALPMWASQRQLPPAERERLRALRLRNTATGLANSLRGMGAGAQDSLWEALPTLKMPVCCIYGELDVKFGAIAQAMRAVNPVIELRPVAGAGHAVHLEAPDTHAMLIRNWLSMT